MALITKAIQQVQDVFHAIREVYPEVASVDYVNINLVTYRDADGNVPLFSGDSVDGQAIIDACIAHNKQFCNGVAFVPVTYTLSNQSDIQYKLVRSNNKFSHHPFTIVRDDGVNWDYAHCNHSEAQQYKDNLPELYKVAVKARNEGRG